MTAQEWGTRLLQLTEKKNEIIGKAAVRWSPGYAKELAAIEDELEILRQSVPADRQQVPDMRGIQESSEALHISAWMVRKLCSEGRVRSIRNGAKLLVDFNSLCAYLGGGEGDAG